MLILEFMLNKPFQEEKDLLKVLARAAKPKV